MNRRIDWPRYSRWTWIVAALLIVLLVFLRLGGQGPEAGACCGGESAVPPVAAAVAPASTMPAAEERPAASTIRVDDDRRVLEGTVPSDATTVVPATPVARPEDVRCAERMPAAVTFATASSRIDAKGRALLDAIAPCLHDGRFEIAGHTDSIGSNADNLALSKARAESVRAYMILKGIDADRLVAVGYGALHPTGDNATRAGRAGNRRIEFAKK